MRTYREAYPSDTPAFTYNGHRYTYRDGMILMDGKPKLFCVFGPEAFKLWAQRQGFRSV